MINYVSLADKQNVLCRFYGGWLFWRRNDKKISLVSILILEFFDRSYQLFGGLLDSSLVLQQNFVCLNIYLKMVFIHCLENYFSNWTRKKCLEKWNR